MPAGTDTSVFSNTPASGQQWVEWNNKGKTYYAIVPITTPLAKIKASYPKPSTQVTVLAPATVQQQYNAANGVSSGANAFTAGSKVTMPDWKKIAQNYGIDPNKLPASLVASSLKPINLASLTKLTGASQSFGTNLYNTLQQLSVD